MGLRKEWMRVNAVIFFLEEFRCVWTRGNFYIEILGPVEYSTPQFFGAPTNEKIRKNSIFQFCLKCDLNGFRYRFRVQNGSKTPKGHISGHISYFRTLPANLWKFEILAKIVILANFDVSRHGRLHGREWLEI